MGAETKIEWCDHTFNPWRGCTKVSPGCDHCYAETMSHRNPAVLGEWGPGAPRVESSESYWQLPLKWHREAVRAGVRRRVFCASLADVFDSEAPPRARRRLWGTIQATSGYLTGHDGRGGLDWLLLTKRPERIGDVYREDKIRVGFFRENRCWMGVTVESQEYTGRIWAVKDWGCRTFISYEPALGPLDLPNALAWSCACGNISFCEVPVPGADPCPQCRSVWRRPPVDWVIAGGESGPHARPSHPEWFRKIRDDCIAAGVPFLFKQWGEYAPPGDETPRGSRLVFVDRRGGITAAISPYDPGCPCDQAPSEAAMVRVGKHAAGRLLDGVEWSQFPEAREPVHADRA